MFGLILNFLGSSLLKPVLSYLQQKDSSARDIKLAEIGSDKDQAIALVQAEVAANKERAAVSHDFKPLVYMTALPYVLHSGAVMLDSTFSFGWNIPAAPGPFSNYESQILLSLFVLSPVGLLSKAVATKLTR